MSNFDNSNQPNPYAAPVFPIEAVESRNELQLADLGRRFLGALIDNFMVLPFLIPGFILLFIGIGIDEQGPGGASTNLYIGSAIAFVIGVLTVMGIQIYLLYTRSQSIGKYILKTRIVNYQTGQPADFVHCFLLRTVVNTVISIVVGIIPIIGSFYGLIDACFIFRSDRRCLHDLIANTVVIDLP